MRYGMATIPVLIMLGLPSATVPSWAGAAEPLVAAADLPRLAPREPDQALATFRIKPGFHLELAAAEPLVMDPIAMAFDENGRLFVVEMRDYSERREEKLGRIRLLDDTDQDGRFDRSTVYAQELAWPTAVICWNGGVFVGVTPDILYFKDHDNDGVADERKVVFTGFAKDVSRLNVQALLNSFLWGLDNRIHGATSFNGGTVVAVGTNGAGAKPVALRGRDFSFDPRRLDLRPESGGGQHGLTFDDAGRKFVCSNSHHIQQLMYEDRYGARGLPGAMPPPLLDIAIDGPAAEVFRLSPDEPWRIVRTRWRVAGLVPGPVEGGGRVSGYFTAATGITVYRGNAWPAAYRGDVFIGDAGSNLIHHKKLRPHGVASQAFRPPDEAGMEFVTSTDNWFRPVQFANAPDGCLYVADMYREVIEHPWSLPQSIKQHLDLNSGHDRGRIYRIVPDGFKQPPLPRLGEAATAGLVHTLEHPNGWHRDTASRLLMERQDPEAPELLVGLLGKTSVAAARLHALYLLDGMMALWGDTLRVALEDTDAQVRRHAARLTESFFLRQSSFTAKIEKKLLALAGDPDPGVRQEVAFRLGIDSHSQHLPSDRLAALNRLLASAQGDRWIESAVLSGLGNQAPALLEEMLATRRSLWKAAPADWARAARHVATLIGAGNDPAQVGWVIETALAPARPSALSEFEWLLALDEGLQKAGKSLGQIEAGDRLNRAWGRAAATAVDTNQPAATRAQALALLALAPHPPTPAVLTALLRADQPEAVREASWAALIQASKRDRDRMRALSERWPQLTPSWRRQVVAALLGWAEGTALLLEAVETDRIPPEDLSAGEIASLREHRSEPLRARALKVWGLGTSPEQTAQRLLPAIAMEGNLAAGKAIFETRCAPCHRLGTVGTERALGPDLATVKNAGKEKILLNIVDPNGEVAPNMVSYTVEIRGGESLSGLIVSENPNGLTLRQAGGVDTSLPRSQVLSMHSEGKSVMPEGLAEGLSAQDMADLLEFILGQNP